MKRYKYAAINTRSLRVVAMADTLPGLYPECSQEWVEACERRKGEWVSVDGLQRHPDGNWRGGDGEYIRRLRQ